jgi:hypothetical protein
VGPIHGVRTGSGLVALQIPKLTASELNFLPFRDTLDLREPLCRIAEAVEFQAAPLHQAEEQAAHSPVGRIQIVEYAAAAKFAARPAEQDHRQLLGFMVAVDHAGTVHDGRVVEQRAIAFLDFRHPLAEVGELGREELVDGDEFLRLGVGHLVMLIFGADMRVREDRAVVAIFEGRDCLGSA